VEPDEAIDDRVVIDATQTAKRTPQQFSERNLVGDDDAVVWPPF
jgi:hypothetical protein